MSANLIFFIAIPISIIRIEMGINQHSTQLVWLKDSKIDKRGGGGGGIEMAMAMFSFQAVHFP